MNLKTIKIIAFTLMLGLATVVYAGDAKTDCCATGTSCCTGQICCAE